VEVSLFWYVLGALLFSMVVWFLWSWRQKRAQAQNPILWAYGRLERSALGLGLAQHPSQTPAEFENALLADLSRPARPEWSSDWRRDVQPDIARLASLFSEHQYSGKQLPVEQAVESWYRIRTRMWLLGVLNRLFRRSGKMEQRR
jgi:hypothetical protein